MREQRESLAGVENVDLESGSLSLAEHTAELATVTTGVHGFRTIMFNLYAVEEKDGSWVLIDGGLPGSKEKISEWLRGRYEGVRPEALLLTHGHFDHTGAVAELAREWGVPIFAHEEELPFLTGRRAYPPPDPSVGGGIMSLLSPFFPKKPVDLTGLISPLPGDGKVPGLPSWRWIHTPGHTDGHVSFLRDEDRMLIAGDAVTTTKQESFWAILRQKAELHGPPAYFTSDWTAAKVSVEKLAGLQPEFLAAGHGKPLQGQAVREGLKELAEHFDELAVPQNKRV